MADPSDPFGDRAWMEARRAKAWSPPAAARPKRRRPITPPTIHTLTEAEEIASMRGVEPVPRKGR